MAYFKINNVDYSMYVNSLKITTNTKYNAQTNAAGNSVVDYINQKRNIEVGIIPLDDAIMANLKTAIDNFNVSISFLNPNTKTLEENVDVIIPSNEIQYYKILVNKVSFDGFTLKFTELQEVYKWLPIQIK